MAKRKNVKPIKHILQLEADATPADIAQISKEAAKLFAPERVLVISTGVKYFSLQRKRQNKILTLRINKQ